MELPFAPDMIILDDLSRLVLYSCDAFWTVVSYQNSKVVAKHIISSAKLHTTHPYCKTFELQHLILRRDIFIYGNGEKKLKNKTAQDATTKALSDRKNKNAGIKILLLYNFPLFFFFLLFLKFPIF